MNLVVQPMHDWRTIEDNGYATRDAHFLQHFADNGNVDRILVINRPVSVYEIFVKKKKFKIRSGVKIISGFGWGVYEINEKIFVLDVLCFDLIKPLIYRRSWWNVVFKSKRVSKIVVKSMAQLFNSMPVELFLWNPMATNLFNIIKPSRLIFDALDNWLVHPEMKDRFGLIRQGYDFLLKEADLFYVNSNQSCTFFSKTRGDVKLILNGVDSSYFKIPENKELPNDLIPLKNKPVVGYAGKLAKRIDVDLVILLAEKFPDVNFVIIGVVLDINWVSRIFSISNIFYLGNKKYNIYPKYLNGFDICIIPHNVGELECGGDPIKLYEYLSCDKPVISTNIAEVEQFRECISIAYTHNEFVEHLRCLLSSRKISTINCIKPEHEWRYKANIIIDDIMSSYR